MKQASDFEFKVNEDLVCFLIDQFKGSSNFRSNDMKKFTSVSDLLARVEVDLIPTRKTYVSTTQLLCFYCMLMIY